MANVALNKNADASSSMFPYQPGKAVDGVLTPLNRWVGSSPLPPSGTPAPVWLRVDLGAFYWINRWVVKQMGAVGWPVPPSTASCNMVDYKLQGSLDNTNWFDIDTVTNNSANQTDRTITPRKVQWVRVYITKGLRCNNNFASIAELEVYDAPNAPSLTGLTISSGTLSPAFSSSNYSYSDSVGSDVGSVTVTPSAASGTIKVNNQVVTSGSPSQSITLATGNNIVTVTVTSADNLMTETYTINVTKTGNAAYLSDLVLKNTMNAVIPLTPSIFNKNTYNYTATTSVSAVKVTPTAEVSSSTITVNGQSVQNGQQSQTISLTTGLNTITIIVTGSDSGQGTYTIGVTKS